MKNLANQQFPTERRIKSSNRIFNIERDYNERRNQKISKSKSSQSLYPKSVFTKENINQNLICNSKFRNEKYDSFKSNFDDKISTSKNSPLSSGRDSNSFKQIQVDSDLKVINHKLNNFKLDFEYFESEESLDFRDFSKINDFKEMSFSNEEIMKLYEVHKAKIEEIEDSLTYLKECISFINSLENFFESNTYNNLITQNMIKALYNITNIVLNKDINCNKDILVLDMDETLLHADYPIKFDCQYDCLINFYDEIMGISIRPGLYKFLEKSSKRFDLVLYSAGKRDYVEKIISKLEISNYFSMILCFDETVNIVDKIFVKDLRIIKWLDKMRDSNNYNNLFRNQDFESNSVENLMINEKIVEMLMNKQVNFKFDNFDQQLGFEKEVIIVDNNIFSFSNNLENGILIEDYFYDKGDIELENLNTLLTNLANEKQENGTLFQTQIKQFFNYKSISN